MGSWGNIGSRGGISCGAAATGGHIGCRSLVGHVGAAGGGGIVLGLGVGRVLLVLGDGSRPDHRPGSHRSLGMAALAATKVDGDANEKADADDGDEDPPPIEVPLAPVVVDAVVSGGAVSSGGAVIGALLEVYKCALGEGGLDGGDGRGEDEVTVTKEVRVDGVESVGHDKEE